MILYMMLHTVTYTRSKIHRTRTRAHINTCTPINKHTQSCTCLRLTHVFLRSSVPPSLRVVHFSPLPLFNQLHSLYIFILHHYIYKLFLSVVFPISVSLSPSLSLLTLYVVLKKCILGDILSYISCTHYTGLHHYLSTSTFTHFSFSSLFANGFQGIACFRTSPEMSASGAMRNMSTLTHWVRRCDP